jgi:hypothetical protein
MLLRQAEPADVDGYISAAAMSSPGQGMPHDTTAARTDDPLDDVFGSDGEDGAPPGEAQRNHPSDMYRLRQEHTTAGYREGITAAKGTSMQAGFDEGFGLGATIGLKAGYLVGVLEGIAEALSRDSSLEAERAEAGRLLAEAKAELGARAVFSPEYWDSDGTWKYEVGSPGAQAEEAEAEEEDVVFSHVAEAHPLVRKWTLAVGAQMRRWGLAEQVPLLQRREDEDVGAEPEARVKVVAAQSQPQPDAKVGNDALSW